MSLPGARAEPRTPNLEASTPSPLAAERERRCKSAGCGKFVGVCGHWRPGAEKLCPAALQRLRPGYLVWLAEEGSECPQGHWGVTKRDGEAVRQEI